jgi:looped-hinge helix DNA binding domain, AbrB family
MSDAEEGTTVTVTSKGQATIPKAYREKLSIETPGRVRFVETEAGEIVVRPVKRPSELRGALADAEADSETAATDVLRAEREQATDALDEKHGLADDA